MNPRSTLLLFCCVLLFVGCREMKIRELIDQAETEKSNGNDSLAIEMYETIFEMDRRDENPYIQIGFIHLRNNEHGKAEKFFPLAIEMNDKNKRAYFGLASSKYGQYKNREALVCIDQTISLDPTYTKALNLKGQILQMTDDHDEAIVFFKKAIDIDSNYLSPVTGIALSYLGQEDNRNAEPYVMKAINMDSTDCTAVQNFALFHYRIDKQTIACDFAHKAFDICSSPKSLQLIRQIQDYSCR